MPRGSAFFYMPGHVAFGWDPALRSCVGVRSFAGGSVFPVAAFPIPGFTRLFLPAAKKEDRSITLPLWPYTAAGWEKGKFFIGAFQVDRSLRQRPYHYQDKAALERGIERTVKDLSGNRLVRHLARCSRIYNCRNAQDFFLGRGEAPLPVSPACNAGCVGCLSFQESDGAASHSRIDFVPRPEEVADVALLHIRRAKHALVSFGQGCEGEPLLQFKVIKEALGLIRKATAAGTIHLNTNGFSPGCIEELASCGLDSVRISLNSLDPSCYQSYYRPKGFSLQDVLGSFRAARQSGLFVSCNLLVFPGVTDTIQESRRVIGFLKKGQVDLLQLRNLSIDPELLMRHVPAPAAKDILGILSLADLLKKECPRLRLGYFNLPKARFHMI